MARVQGVVRCPLLTAGKFFQTGVLVTLSNLVAAVPAAVSYQYNRAGPEAYLKRNKQQSSRGTCGTQVIHDMRSGGVALPLVYAVRAWTDNLIGVFLPTGLGPLYGPGPGSLI